MEEIDDFYSDEKDFWTGELDDEDVIIEDERVPEYEEEDMDEVYNALMEDDEQEIQDPILSSWMPAKPSKPTSVTNEAKYAFNYLTNKGLPKHVSAGIVGNLMKESNLNPTIKERGNTGNGRGIAQWDVRDRYLDLQQFASSSNRDFNSLDTQLDFVLHESKQRGDLDKTMQAKTPEEAAMIFGKTYERPNEKYADWGSRQSYARGLSNMQYGGVNNIPKDISREDLLEYYEDENAPFIDEDAPLDESDSEFGYKAAGIVQNVGKAVEGYKNWKNDFNQFTNNISSTTSKFIDFQSELAGNQQNAISLRKFNERKNQKKFQFNTKSRNSPLIMS